MSLIEDYQNQTGEHCGSTAMRNLLAHYCGLSLSEACVVGLGSAIDCMLIEPRDLASPPVVFGRGITMEVDCASALGIGYVEMPDMDDDHAWAVVREEVRRGRPTMLSGDPLYLDYHPSPVHFPAHRFVLVGLDDDKRQAYIADRQWGEPQVCSYESLAASRNPKDYPLTTFNLWGRFDDTEVRHTLPEAMRTALGRHAARMLGRDTLQADMLRMAVGGSAKAVTTGLAGIERLAVLTPSLAGREDAASVARGLYYTFERFGTGGGNFRHLYADFLQEVLEAAPDLVTEAQVSLGREAAEAWSTLAAQMREISDGATEGWAACAELLPHIHTTERALFEGIDHTIQHSKGKAHVPG